AAYQPENAAIKLYPNPAADYCYLNLTELPQETAQVEVFSITGQVLMQKTVTAGNIIEVDILSLSAGKYLVRVKSNTFLKTLHLVKE
ncbi:MAG: hypothetical protein COW65_07485, partial [Cytophagales bacterium CG18_big_fil_WC_8_21_14_2_50_42_9]